MGNEGSRVFSSWAARAVSPQKVMMTTHAAETQQTGFMRIINSMTPINEMGNGLRFRSANAKCAVNQKQNGWRHHSCCRGFTGQDGADGDEQKQRVVSRKPHFFQNGLPPTWGRVLDPRRVRIENRAI